MIGGQGAKVKGYADVFTIVTHLNMFRFDALLLPFAWMLFASWRTIRLMKRIRRGRRGRLGTHCRRCGYDLRATPDRCPECGTVPKSAKPPSAPATPGGEAGPKELPEQR
jgi:hypothetical protein